MSRCLFRRFLSTSPNQTTTASGKPHTVSHEQRQLSELTSLSLAEAPKCLSASGPYKPQAEEKEAQITTLSNGLRVASLYRFGAGCTVGIVMSAGPRFQSGFTKGISHVTEKLSFSPTKQFSTRDSLYSEMEKCGSIFDTQSTKDATIYAVSGNPQYLGRIVNALSEVVTNSLLNEEDIEDAKNKVRFEWESLEANPSIEPILTDILHSAAYSNNTLGFPKYCPLDNVDKITRQEIINYIGTYYRPERMVLCGIGVHHDELVQAAEKSFLKSDWPVIGKLQADESVAQYTGGCVQTTKPRNSMHVALGLPELVHVAVGLESCSTTDADFVPSCVLHMMMGGGGSFSAGGPGKGMYTRLYTRVLNRYHWAHHTQAANQAYTDTGLFGILASAPPSQVRDMCQVVCQEIQAVSTRLPPDEVSRAKKQLQSMLMMNLEMRPIIFEDIGRQILSSGQRRSPQYWFDEIEKVEEKHLVEFARRMLLSKPAFVVYGPSLSQVPSVDDIQDWLTSSESKSRFSSFFSRHL